MKKNLLLAITLLLAMTCSVASCSNDDADDNNFKWPVGQWIHEGSDLPVGDFDALLFDIAANGPTAILGRWTENGKWYNYPLKSTYRVEATSATEGTISYAGVVYTFRLTDSALTLERNGKSYGFHRTSGIKSEGQVPEVTTW
jgi:nucleoside-specific outer membrane channel protein Tsx